MSRAPSGDVIFGDWIAAGDVDGDGLADLVTASHNTGDAPDGELARRELETLLSPAAVRSVELRDFDGDGAMDVVAALQDGRLLTFRGDGRGSVVRDADIGPYPWRSGCSAYAMRVADLDGDARDEVIATFAGEACSSNGGIEVWRTAEPRANRRRAVQR